MDMERTATYAASGGYSCGPNQWPYTEGPHLGQPRFNAIVYRQHVERDQNGNYLVPVHPSVANKTINVTIWEQQRHENEVGAFLYTCFLLFLYSLLILYFVLRNILHQQREFYEKIHGTAQRNSQSDNPSSPFSGISRTDRELREVFKKQFCTHMVKMGQLTEVIGSAQLINSLENRLTHQRTQETHQRKMHAEKASKHKIVRDMACQTRQSMRNEWASTDDLFDEEMDLPQQNIDHHSDEDDEGKVNLKEYNEHCVEDLKPEAAQRKKSTDSPIVKRLSMVCEETEEEDVVSPCWDVEAAATVPTEVAVRPTCVVEVNLIDVDEPDTYL